MAGENPLRGLLDPGTYKNRGDPGVEVEDRISRQRNVADTNLLLENLLLEKPAAQETCSENLSREWMLNARASGPESLPRKSARTINPRRHSALFAPAHPNTPTPGFCPILKTPVRQTIYPTRQVPNSFTRSLGVSPHSSVEAQP
jgi:hypothetical protein